MQSTTTRWKANIFNHALLKARAAPEDIVPETITNDNAHSIDMVDVSPSGDKIDRAVGDDGIIASSNSNGETIYSRPRSLGLPRITNINGGAIASNGAQHDRFFSENCDSDGELSINNLEGDIKKMEL